VKTTQYLLKLRDEDDKSKFLEQAGYTAAHTERLLQDLRGLLVTDAEFVQKLNMVTSIRFVAYWRGQMAARSVSLAFWMTERATGQNQVCDPLS